MALHRIRRVFNLGITRRDVGPEVAAELEFHFQATIESLVAAGYSRGAAEEEAHRRFGDYKRYRKQLEQMTRRRLTVARLGEWVKTVGQDIAYAARGIARAKAFSASAVLTLGLGIAATTVMVSLLKGVVFQPLPFPGHDRLVRIYDTALERGRLSSTSSPANFVDWRDLQTPFVDIAAFVNARATYTDVQPAEPLLGANVSAEWFRVLGVAPVHGRAFTRDEEVAGNDRVVIVSHGVWQRYLNGDPDVVGRTMSLEGEPHTVVGVMPPGFAFPTPETDVWRPLAFNFDVSTSRGVHYLTVIGRLGPDQTLASAEAAMNVLMTQLVEAHPEQLRGWGVRLTTLHESIISNTGSRMLIFMGAVLLVLAIAWVNVANLVMARATSRAREFGVRAALGAGRWRLVRQLIAESVVLTGLAGATGLMLATWILNGVASLAAGNIPRIESVAVDVVVVVAVVILAIVLGVLLGLTSVIAAAPLHHGIAWARSGRGEAGHGHYGLRNGFVVAQIAIAMLLCVAAGLLVRSFAALGNVDPGYATERALTATIAIPGSRYPDDAARARFFLDLTDRLTALPGVTRAAATTQLPLEGYSINFSYWIDGEPLRVSERPNGDFRVVTPGYFATMNIPIRRGRGFRRADTPDALPVIVINEVLAEQQFPDRDPVGQRLHISYGGEDTPREIVGIVGAVKQRALDVPAVAAYYLPIQQVTWSTMRIVMQTDIEPLALTAPLRHAVAALDPLLSVRAIRTLEQRFVASVGSPRFNTYLIASFALVALILAVSGVYSVTSYVVAQRTREIGVRMALGAEAGTVRSAVTMGAVRLAAVGVVIGIALALGTTRLLSSLLFEVTTTDALTFTIAASVFVAGAWLGSYVPARRASSVDPIIALRAE